MIRTKRKGFWLFLLSLFSVFLFHDNLYLLTISIQLQTKYFYCNYCSPHGHINLCKQWLIHFVRIKNNVIYLRTDLGGVQCNNRFF